jgi:hypothetical protein
VLHSQEKNVAIKLQVSVQGIAVKREKVTSKKEGTVQSSKFKNSNLELRTGNLELLILVSHPQKLNFLYGGWPPAEW